MVVQDLYAWHRGEYNLALQSLKRKIFTVHMTNGVSVLITHPTNEKEPDNMKFSSFSWQTVVVTPFPRMMRTTGGRIAQV